MQFVSSSRKTLYIGERAINSNTEAYMEKRKDWLIFTRLFSWCKLNRLHTRKSTRVDFHPCFCYVEQTIRKKIVYYLGIKEGSEDGNGGTKGIDGLNRCLKDDDGWDNDRYALHRVAYAKGQRWDLVQRHVWYLIIQVIEYALCSHPPKFTIYMDAMSSN